VILDNSIHVDNDAIVVAEVTGDEKLLEILMERNGESGNNVTQVDEDGDDEHVITIAEASNMALRLRRFVMTKKDVLDCVLESTEILQEIAEKTILKWAVQKTLPTFFIK
jgi:hypothetical protein